MHGLYKIAMITGSLCFYAHLYTQEPQSQQITNASVQINCSCEELDELIALAQNDPSAQPKSVSAFKAFLRKIGCAIVLKYLAAKEYLQTVTSPYLASLINMLRPHLHQTITPHNNLNATPPTTTLG